MFPFLDNSHLYTMFEMQRAALLPVSTMAQWGTSLHGPTLNPFAYTGYNRTMAAGFEVLERLTRQYHRPEWRIHTTMVDEQSIAVTVKITKKKPFCHLLHFKKDTKKKQPKLLIVAPMSGHFSTLLRGTVEGFLPYYDVYITDWLNARDIPLSAGEFNLDDYIDYTMEFCRVLGPQLNVLAVCQPAVPVLCAVSLMSTQKDPMVPATMTLIGGPIDARKNPTAVNKVATERSDIWFEKNVITRVPFNYPGFMRPVYAGFIQLGGFMAMNWGKHVDAHLGLFQHLVEGDGDSADAHREFYNEYLSVMDITAEFYMQTIQKVFKEFDLANHRFVSRDRPVNPADITQTRLLVIEGSRDDISGIGQTKAALRLCAHLPKDKKQYHLQKDVGHYGLFNGRRFREQIIPVIREFIQS